VTKTNIGQCIYCRTLPTSTEPLSDEHILPFGIYGKHQLGKASCKKCAAITSDFEGKVQRDDMRNLRSVIGFPTRHKKRKPTLKLPHEIVTRCGQVQNIEASAEDAPAIMILPVFKAPAYVSKEPYQDGIE